MTRPVTVNGREYESINDACVAYGVDPTRAYMVARYTNGTPEKALEHIIISGCNNKTA